MINILLFVLVFNCNVLDIVTNKIHISIPRKPIRRRTVASAIFANHSPINAIGGNSTANQTEVCRWLRGFKDQRNQCQKRRGLAQVLTSARHLAITQCEEQFKYDQWNCSYKKDLYKKMYRETAFMQSLATAAIMYTTAMACSDGKLENCPCATPDEEPPKRPDWKWGGCGDNTKKARNIVRKFMLPKQPNDSLNEVLISNTELGIKSVMEREKVYCNCHGVSASCAMKVCWKRLTKPFDSIAEKLKYQYHVAIRLNPRNSPKRPSIKKARASDRLLYLAEDRNYCNSTVGRRCRNANDCATLCCSRGYTERVVTVYKRCHYRFHGCCYNVTYDICETKENVFHCK